MVFLQRPGGMRVISRVPISLSPISYAGHCGPTERLREATHHLTHVIPVRLEWIPGERANTVANVNDLEAEFENLAICGQVLDIKST